MRGVSSAGAYLLLRFYFPSLTYSSQVISQALVSATNSVDPAFGLHSLHVECIRFLILFHPHI